MKFKVGDWVWTICKEQFKPVERFVVSATEILGQKGVVTRTYLVTDPDNYEKPQTKVESQLFEDSEMLLSAFTHQIEKALAKPSPKRVNK